MPSSMEPGTLRRRIDPKEFTFETTAELAPLKKPLGQERALRALEFGLGMESPGYNIFVVGETGAGKRTTTLTVLEEAAKLRPVPGDWVYVYNFEDEEKPLALSLPAGMGETLRQDMEALVHSLTAEVPRAFSGDAYEKEKAAILKVLQVDGKVLLGGNGYSPSLTRLRRDAPFIDSQPTSQTVLPDATVTSTASASGISPLFYQWYKDGSPLPGATGTG